MTERTFKDALDARLPGLANALEARSAGIGELAALTMETEVTGLAVIHRGGGIVAFECPGCRLPVAADMLVDVAAAPASLTGGIGWACTGCLDGWWRKGRSLADGSPATRAEILEAVGGEVPRRDGEYWGAPAFPAILARGRT